MRNGLVRIPVFISFWITMIFIPLAVCAQEWNSARLTVLHGGNVNFNFNSINKFKNGIELASVTRVGISMVDSSRVGHDLEGFVLNFRSFNSQANIAGEAGTLALDRIRVKAENCIGLGAGTSLGYQFLTSDWVPLFSYTNPAWTDLNWANNQLNLSIDCGIPVASGGSGSLIGENSDYFNVEIELELVPTGPGF